MSATFTVDPQRIFHISSPETTKTSEILELIELANALACELERVGWDEIPPEVQKALLRLAYEEWGSLSLPQRLVARLRYTVLVLKGDEEVLNKLWNAANRLRRAVLDAIERSNPEYEKDLAEAIKDALSDTDGRTMSAEQSRERNRQIFDQAFD